jgi:hypothetical protein
MKVFYGAAIQGLRDSSERIEVNQFLINCIKENGFNVSTEHTSGKTYEEVIKKMEESIGKMPEGDLNRRVFVRDKMIEAIEGDVCACVFEVSVPSLGTGIEIAHAYLRPRIGLKEIPILALYEKDYWPNKLSTMIRGISDKEIPHFILREYENIDEAKKTICKFLTQYAKE